MAGRSKRLLTAPVEPLRHAVQGYWASQLALHLLDEEFGTDVRAVGAALLALGSCTLSELKAYLVRCSKAVCRVVSEVINHAEEGVLGGGRARMQGMEPEEVPLGAPASAERVRVCMLVLASHRLLAMDAVDTSAAASLGPVPRSLTMTPFPQVSAAAAVAGVSAAPATAASRRGATESAADRAAKAVLARVAAAAAASSKPRVAPRTSAAARDDNDEEDTMRKVIRYRLDVPAILLRTRVAHFISTVFRTQGGPGCVIARVCVRRGAWFKDSILTEAARTHAAQTDASGEHELTSANVGTAFTACKTTWERMTAKQLLVPDDGVLRFGVPRSLTAEKLAVGPTGGATSRGLVSPSPRPAGEAHGRESTLSNTSDAPPGEADGDADMESRVLWRFGWESAMKRLRSDLVISFVLACAGAGDDGADQTRRMLDSICILSESRETGYMAVRSNPVSVAEICDTINARAAPRVSPDAVNASLQRIVALPCGALTQGASARLLAQSRTFQLEYRTCLFALQLRAIIQHVTDTHGHLAARIIRALLDKGSLDDKVLADACMVTQKDAREAAYALASKGYVTIAEIPKRSDHMPQHTYYVFSASFHKLSALLVERLHHTLLNLRKRLRMESVRVSAVTAQVDFRSAATGEDADTSTAANPLHNGAHLAEVMHEGLQRLRIGCLRVDDALLLMRDLHFPDVEFVTPTDISEYYATAGKGKR